MEKKILIAYGTAAGSTAEVANFIKEEMQKDGAHVDVQPVEDITSIDSYDAVIVGSAVRAFHILGKTRRFLRRYRKMLRKVPVAYFLVCLTMSEETPENIRRATGFAKPMLRVKEPVSLGLFAGCMDPEKLTGFFAMPMKSMPKEDKRDWDKIGIWAHETLPKLIKPE